MDETLRAALRDGDWSERAATYRRAGEEDRARREVARAARAGLEDAREALEEFPHDADARALLEVLAAPPDASQRAAWAAQILWGDGDPRLGAAAETWLERTQRRGLQEGFAHLLIRDYVERIGRFLGSRGPALERTRLSEGEGIALLEGLPPVPSPLQLLQLRFLSLESESPEFVERVSRAVAAHRQGERIEGVVEVSGRAGGSSLPWRPGWVRPCLRDPQTLALSRHALRGPNLSPGAFELPRAASSILIFALDGLRDSNDRLGMEASNRHLDEVVGCAMREGFGDRVVRWLGNRFLVPYEGPRPEEGFQACLVASRRASGMTISGALLSKAGAERGASWALALEEGLAQARERGPGSLEVIG